MDKNNLLDCTLRDGGYINRWKFKDDEIQDMIASMTTAGLDFVEVGYIDRNGSSKDTTRFPDIGSIARYLPADRMNTTFLAMADVQEIGVEDIEPNDGRSVEGIRVVFYKHQIEEAMALAKAVREKGYLLFMQPMVTIDYTTDEYAHLTREIAKLNPYAVSVVDSFGYMLKSDYRRYFNILDNILPVETVIGFHSHNNMNLAFITAQDVMEYETTRRLIIDCSLYGMGRGAGNLNTEIIANYYNMTLGRKYDTDAILELISKYIMEIYDERSWGYSPYLFITGLFHYHPNFACYLLEEEDVTVEEFERFLLSVPGDMKTKCRKPYVIAKWKEFKDEQNRSYHAD